MMLRFLCFLGVILGAKSALAPFIKPCDLSDNACLISSAQAAVPFIAPGIPELGIKSLDPMNLGVVKSNEGGLALTLMDTIVTGMKGCHVDGIKHDSIKGKQEVTIRCSVVLDGNYKMSGQLLVLPISGEGKHQIKLRDIIIKAYTDLETVDDAEGKPHWHIRKWRHTFNVKTNTHFSFENLFNGNKFLANTVIDFANTNWREVMKEIAPPIVSAIVKRTVEAVEALYKAVPKEELTLN